MSFKRKNKHIAGRGRAGDRSGEIMKKLAVLTLGIILIGGGLCGASFLVYRGLSRSDFFQVTSIRIDGCRHVSKKQILNLSGIDVHSNLLSIDTGNIKERIVELDWIKHADVKRDWPNSVTILIQEKKPAAVASLADGLYYLDGHGGLITRVLPSQDVDFPVITGLEAAGGKITGKHEALREALLFIRYAGRGNPVLPRQNISEINLTGEAGCVLYLMDRPFPIYLGQGGIVGKYFRLAKVLYRLYKKDDFTRTAYIRMDYTDHNVLVGMT